MKAADGFIAAIRANPDDDLPRLVYADYLDERGDPLGLFVRVQVQLAYTAEDDPARAALVATEAELLAAHEVEWLGRLGDELVRWWFHRGFVEVSLDVRRFLTADADWLSGPMVAGIHLYPPTYMEVETVIELARSPRAERARSLYLGYEWVRDVGVRAIAEASYFANLAALDLNTNGVTDAGLAELCASGKLPKLRALVLSNNLITDAGVATLAGAAHLSGLRQLDLSQNEITAVGAAALAATPYLGRLTTLKLFGNHFNGRSRGGRALKKRFGGVASWR